MKVILFLVVSCLALHNGKGAPKNAVYKFVKCNPEGGQANCVTYESPEVEWSPDLPAKLPSSTAQYLEAEPADEEDYNQYSKSDYEEVETPVFYPTEEGSGIYEGSADSYMADVPVMSAESQKAAGRGESRFIRRLLRRPLLKDATPAEQELKEDHLLQL